MTDQEQFENWWEYQGERIAAYTAYEWARHGWLAHKIHGRGLEGEVIETDLALENEKNQQSSEGR